MSQPGSAVGSRRRSRRQRPCRSGSRGGYDGPRPPARVARPVLPESFLERVRAAAEAARREEEQASSDTPAAVVPATTGSAFVPPSREAAPPEAPSPGAPGPRSPGLRGAGLRSASPQSASPQSASPQNASPGNAVPRSAIWWSPGARAVTFHALDLVAAAGTGWVRRAPAACTGSPAGAVGSFPGTGAGRDPGRRRR